MRRAISSSLPFNSTPPGSNACSSVRRSPFDLSLDCPNEIESPLLPPPNPLFLACADYEAGVFLSQETREDERNAAAGQARPGDDMDEAEREVFLGEGTRDAAKPRCRCCTVLLTCVVRGCVVGAWWVRGSSNSPRLPLCLFIFFFFWPSTDARVAELARKQEEYLNEFTQAREEELLLARVRENHALLADVFPDGEDGPCEFQSSGRNGGGGGKGSGWPGSQRGLH